MEESDKLPLKRVELSLSKFNEVAIPHHLDLLRQHRANIINYGESGAWARVRTEQTHAMRVTSQLRALLSELEALRRRVREPDLPRFDAATQRSRDLTLRSIQDYLETSPLSANRRMQPAACESESAVVGSAVSSDSVGVLSLAEADQPLIRLQIDEQELGLREREDVLRGWSALQDEVRALHHVWQHVAGAALHQRAQVAAVAERTEQTDENVLAARTHLTMAEKLRGGAVSLGGACAGALVGGPAGAALGLKAGAAAALLGSALGYLAARALASRRGLPASAPPASAPQGEHEDKKRK